MKYFKLFEQFLTESNNKFNPEQLSKKFIKTLNSQSNLLKVNDGDTDNLDDVGIWYFVKNAADLYIDKYEHFIKKHTEWANENKDYITGDADLKEYINLRLSVLEAALDLLNQCKEAVEIAKKQKDVSKFENKIVQMYNKTIDLQTEYFEKEKPLYKENKLNNLSRMKDKDHDFGLKYLASFFEMPTNYEFDNSTLL
jgi:hypothetical protein